MMGVPRFQDLTTRAERDFYYAVIGDSWGSGVTYATWDGGNMNYDDNSSGCQRLKNAWATVIEGHGEEWGPEGHKPKLCFEACSGRHMSQMGEELDKCVQYRPKVTVMQVAGNDADFYPMADACLFLSDPRADYGPAYEDDDPENPKGKCRQEINRVRGNILGTNGNKAIKDQYIDTINMWKNHRGSQGNDASLYTVGYPHFFGLSDVCEKWTFQVWTWPITIRQAVKVEMQRDFNDLVDLVDKAIREATESFNDPKIQYIDINPAFNDHRFCEPGSGWLDQLNYGDKVWIWNQPLRLVIALKKGDEVVKSWKIGDDSSDGPSAEDIAGFEQLDGVENQDQGNKGKIYLRNKDKPDMVIEIEPVDKEVHTLDSIARTLHPTGSGHNSIGLLISNELKKTQWPAPDPNLPDLPPENNKAISIMMEKDGDKYNWVFYNTPRGERAGCDTDKEAVFKGPDFNNVDIDHPPNPSGDYNFNAWGKPCKWRGNGDNPGELICNDVPISCQKAADDAPTISCPNSEKKQHEGAYCEFFREQSLSIVLQQTVSFGSQYSQDWIFYETRGGDEGTCGKNNAAEIHRQNLSAAGDFHVVDNPPLPIGEFDLTWYGESCQYKNDGNSPGGLWCGDKKYDCLEANGKGGGEQATQNCSPGQKPVDSHPVVTCQKK